MNNTNKTEGRKVKDLKVGDEVMFKNLVKFPGSNTIYNGWYKIEGFVPDALGKLSVCLEGVPGCWSAKKIGWVREAR